MTNFFKNSGLSMNGVQSHLHVPTHASIYLDMLLLQIQTFTWQVNCKPTLQQLCSVILLQIIHLQLHVEFPFVEIHCKIITMLHSSKVSLFHTLVVFSHSYSYLPKSYRVIPCEMDQISEKFPPDLHGFCWHFFQSMYPTRNENSENFIIFSWTVPKLQPPKLWIF